MINNRRGGFYFIEGKPYISVTNILKVLDKPAIQYWFGNQIYWAMVKDPTLDEKEAMGAPYRTSTKAKDRGSTVHSIIETWKASDKRVTPPKHEGYVEAFYKWIDDNNPEIIFNEKTIYSKEHGYAGTCDLIAKINGRMHVIDFKTNKDGNIYDEVSLQLSAYKLALEEQGEKIEDMLAVALAENGNYSQKAIEDVSDVFLKVKDIWIWKNESKCRSVGYLKGGEK